MYKAVSQTTALKCQIVIFYSLWSDKGDINNRAKRNSALRCAKLLKRFGLDKNRDKGRIILVMIRGFKKSAHMKKSQFLKSYVSLTAKRNSTWLKDKVNWISNELSQDLTVI